MRYDELIDALGRSDAELAVSLCVSPMTIYRWRKGRKVPTPAIRKALAKLAKLPVDQVDWTKKKG